MKREILHLEDVQLLVDTFYSKVRQDGLLGPIFENVIQDQWSKHLNKMYTFWQTVLLGEHTYSGHPFMPHIDLPVEKRHFERWLELFYQTLDENFEGENADEAKWRASKMAEMFLYKLTYFRNSGSTHLI
ncbi:group III truncated hemoglobin [Zobellia uliginosa]|uniref:group III truncated hemoglobin n=1 Tax=Zobellia uliginosa TaxID=143224 RepID=UPI0026E1845D|nr:group III truncated hemoglobin [Zobellia uliginosa]MDO6519414.1 group III truncated hemoglobin [Zobellia uliginosa]